MRRSAVILPFVVWALWTGIVTLFPFDFAAPDADHRVFKLLFADSFSRRETDVVLNALLFLPLGAWLHGEGERRSRGLSDILIAAAAASALLSLTVECLQFLLPTRFPSLLDVAANIAGAVMGVYAHRAFALSAASATAQLRGRTPRGVVAPLTVAIAVGALLASAALQTRTRLSNWNEDYPILVGNEVTGDRAWRGRIFSLELRDVAMPTASLRLFANGAVPMFPGVGVATFDFSGSAPYRDSTGHVPDFDWTSAPREPNGHNAAVSERTWLRTEGAAARMVRRLGESNAFTLRVICASEGETRHRGRIVSNSLNTGERNFSLEQRGDDLVFRLRTPQTGINGGYPEMVVDGVFSDERPRDIVVTYNGATLQAAVANSGVVHSVELSPGSSLAALWIPFIPAHELQRYELTYLAVLFLPPGLLVALFGESVRKRFVWSALYVLGFALALEAALAFVSGRPVDSSKIIATAGVGALVVLTATTVIPSERLVDQRSLVRAAANVGSVSPRR